MHFVLIAAFITASVSLFAQSAASTNAASRRPAPVYSPEIHGGGKVTFRIRAPKASEVKVSGEWSGDTIELTKDAEGVWSVTLGPLAPDKSSKS